MNTYTPAAPKVLLVHPLGLGCVTRCHNSLLMMMLFVCDPPPLPHLPTSPLPRHTFSYRRYTISVALVAVIATFLYYAPWIYALPLNKSATVARRWMSGWD